MRRVVNWLCVAVSIAANIVHAQDPAGSLEPPWYGSSYISYPRQSNLLMEGAVAPSYEVTEFSVKNLLLKLVVTPEILFQMSGDKSSPIHTPSYKPHVGLYGTWKAPGVTLYPFFVAEHHSNGQDGNLYVDSVHINTQSGTFSTNYIQSGYYFSLSGLPHHMIGISFEFHPAKGWFSIDDELKGVYGRKRVCYEYIYSRPAVRLEALYGRIMDDPRGVPAKIYSVKLKWRVPGFRKMVWLFAGYYQGQSYYNVYFTEKIRQLKAGLSIDARIVSNKLIQAN